MRKKATAIPINYLATGLGSGISIERIIIADPHAADEITLAAMAEGSRSHRHDGHSFFLLERGSISVEIDFQTYNLKAPSVMYVHADQVHRTLQAEAVTVSSLAITDENVHPGYLELLENITPAKPLALNKETFSLMAETVSLSLRFAARTNDKLHHSLLKDSSNALIALVVSQYLASEKTAEKLSRPEIVTKAFRELLNRDYTRLKRPADYAEKLHLSAPYLNECVKNITGHSVSHHLQQRVILEAKRLLFYSDHSVKEIAAELGHDDYPYFSRLFTKVTGMTALAFRSKNRD